MLLRESGSVMAEPVENAKVVVVGYGNTLRSDDGFGPAVAELLRSRLSEPRVRVLSRQLLTVDLVADLEQAEFCVLVDAATHGQLGALTLREIVPEPTEPATLGHELSPASLLGLTRQLCGRAPACVLVSTPAQSVELGETLSNEVAALVEIAAAEISARIDVHLEQPE